MTTHRSNSKDKFIQAAHKRFAMFGFGAVSLADIAEDLDLSKQAILYHFKTKEALYGEVLAAMSERFEVIISDVETSQADPSKRWESLLKALSDTMHTNQSDAQLIMRELLDNKDRAATSNQWYLREFLDKCVAFIGDVPEWRSADLFEKRAAVYQAIGAINYLAISGATLTALWGENSLKRIHQIFLKGLIVYD